VSIQKIVNVSNSYKINQIQSKEHFDLRNRIHMIVWTFLWFNWLFMLQQQSQEQSPEQSFWVTLVLKIYFLNLPYFY